jgi:hypothetical protein
LSVHKINKKENLEGKSWNQGKEMVGKVTDSEEKAAQVKFLRSLVGAIVRDVIYRGK